MKLKIKLSLTFFAILLFTLSSCVKSDFDAPDITPIPFDPDKVLTIADIKQISPTDFPYKFDDDYSLFATVVMDDKSGNIYKSAFIQDETGGINIRLFSAGGLYQGDYIRINLKNTVVSQYQKLWQIDSIDTDKNIEKLATWAMSTTIHGDPKPIIEPTLVNIGAIKSDAFQSQLIVLNNVQFFETELGKYFANPNDQFETVNRVLMDCDWNTIIVRTSGFANFADKLLPVGRGSIIAVVSRYRDEFQLLIRNYNEVVFNDPRCDDDDTNLITIQEIRDLYAQGTTVIPANKVVRAVVISDRENENMSSRNAVIMDGSEAGIVLRFSGTHYFDLGTLIRINVGTIPIELYAGLMQLNEVPVGNASAIGPGVLPVPTHTTISDVLANMGTYESTLVTFSNATITGGSTFAIPNTSHGSLTLNDGTGTITLFTYNWAEFAGATVPTGTITITGIVSINNSPQFLIRNLNDIIE
jgi:hypothetical protein